MRRVVHFLLVLAVFLCGTHLVEPGEAQAHVADGAEALSGSASGDDHPAGEEPGKVAHAGHHHCPIAPDPRFSENEDCADTAAAIRFSHPVAALHSLAQAPPLEPPTA